MFVILMYEKREDGKHDKNYNKYKYYIGGNETIVYLNLFLHK